MNTQTTITKVDKPDAMVSHVQVINLHYDASDVQRLYLAAMDALCVINLCNNITTQGKDGVSQSTHSVADVAKNLSVALHAMLEVELKTKGGNCG